MPLDNNNHETGWLSRYAFQRDALSADSIGREAMADGYVTAAKLAASAINSLSHVGVYDLDFYDMALYA